MLFKKQKDSDRKPQNANTLSLDASILEKSLRGFLTKLQAELSKDGSVTEDRKNYFLSHLKAILRHQKDPQITVGDYFVIKDQDPYKDELRKVLSELNRDFPEVLDRSV